MQMSKSSPSLQTVGNLCCNAVTRSALVSKTVTACPWCANTAAVRAPTVPAPKIAIDSPITGAASWHKAQAVSMLAKNTASSSEISLWRSTDKQKLKELDRKTWTGCTKRQATQHGKLFRSECVRQLAKSEWAKKKKLYYIALPIIAKHQHPRFGWNFLDGRKAYDCVAGMRMEAENSIPGRAVSRFRVKNDPNDAVPVPEKECIPAVPVVLLRRSTFILPERPRCLTVSVGHV